MKRTGLFIVLLGMGLSPGALANCELPSGELVIPGQDRVAIPSTRGFIKPSEDCKSVKIWYTYSTQFLTPAPVLSEPPSTCQKNGIMPPNTGAGVLCVEFNLQTSQETPKVLPGHFLRVPFAYRDNDGALVTKFEVPFAVLAVTKFRESDGRVHSEFSTEIVKKDRAEFLKQQIEVLGFQARTILGQRAQYKVELRDLLEDCSECSDVTNKDLLEEPTGFGLPAMEPLQGFGLPAMPAQ